MQGPKIELFFSECKQEFFPEWDQESEWKITFDENPVDPGASGFCNVMDKLIHINLRTAEKMIPEGAQALVIHEICHDAGGEGHSDKWAQRMVEAKNVAHKRGNLKLERLIISSLVSHFDWKTSSVATKDYVLVLANRINGD